MNWISVQIIDDSSAESSDEDPIEIHRENNFNFEAFKNFWKYNSTEEEIEQNPTAIESIGNAYQHLSHAISDINSVNSILQNISKVNSITTQKIKPESDYEFSSFDAIAEKRSILEKCSSFLLSTASSLRDEIRNSQSYFHSLSNISKKIPLELRESQGKTEIHVVTSIHTKTSIIISQNPDSTPQWSLSSPFYFSINSKTLEIDSSSIYVHLLINLMCHELFERFKSGQSKSSIHYSADENRKSINLYIGGFDTWLFELGEKKETGPVPIWFPRLISSVFYQLVDPAIHFSQMFSFISANEMVTQSLKKRFSYLDICSMFVRYKGTYVGFQISSDFLQIPLAIFLNPERLILTETPNELRYTLYNTDGRGLTPVIEKWCDESYSVLFLSMAEKVTLSFGFVFNNKNHYGTAKLGPKKVKFSPVPKSREVEITIITKTTKKLKWSEIPGTNYMTKMCILLFNDSQLT